MNESYERQVQSQIEQYADDTPMHELPVSFHYYNSHFLTPKLARTFNVKSIDDFFAKYALASIQRSGNPQLLSLGSGDCNVEIEIAKLIRALAPEQAFTIRCLDVSPLMADRARANIARNGLDDFVKSEIVDLNAPLPYTRPFGGILANHSLHHFVELELVFSETARLLDKGARFIVSDVVGRNGHMRWPETLQLVRELWRYLPDDMIWNHAHDYADRWFENWDCSIEGFEGVRAQDILPLLNEQFDYDRLLLWGGVSDPFIDRAYGYNFDTRNETHVKFLHAVARVEDHFLSRGAIKPTQIMAVMASRNDPGGRPDQAGTNNAIARAAVRPVDQGVPTEAVSITRIEDLDLGFDEVFSPEFSPATAGDRIYFAAGHAGPAMLRWGWYSPGQDFTWSRGTDSRLEFRLQNPARRIQFRIFDNFPAIVTGRRPFTVSIDGRVCKEIDLEAKEDDLITLDIEGDFGTGEPLVVDLHLDRPRRPDIDGGDDMRPLGIALLSMELLD